MAGAYPPRPLPLQAYRSGGVLTEHRALPNVPSEHRRALVTRLLGDDAFGHAGSGSRGRKVGPQRVTRHLAGVKPRPDGMALQHACWLAGSDQRTWAIKVQLRDSRLDLPCPGDTT